MNTLHILNKHQLPSALHTVKAEDAIVLIQDAVYLMLNNPFKSERVYVLQDDLHARMPRAILAANVNLISYAELVDLCCLYQHNLTW